MQSSPSEPQAELFSPATAVANVDDPEQKQDEEVCVYTPDMWMESLKTFVADLNGLETPDWNSTIQLDYLHDAVMQDVKWAHILTPSFFKCLLVYKILPATLTKPQSRTVYQTNLVWLNNRRPRKIVVPPETPPSLLHFMIMYAYAVADGVKSHPARSVELGDQEVMNWEEYFYDATKAKGAAREIARQNIGVLSAFFSFYVFLLLHELHYGCKEKSVSKADFMAISLWRTHVFVMMQRMTSQSSEVFACFDAGEITQRLYERVIDQAVDWNLMQRVYSTMSIAKPLTHQNSDDDDSDESQEQQQPQRRHRGKAAVSYDFERIPP